MQRLILNVLKPYAVMVIYFFFPINVLLKVSFHRTPYCIYRNEVGNLVKPFIRTTLSIRISLKLFHIQDTL